MMLDDSAPTPTPKPVQTSSNQFTAKVVIRLELKLNRYSSAEHRATVYRYLTELIDDNSLDFEVTR